jgi:hypothetical protein
MPQKRSFPEHPSNLAYDRTLILAIELSNKTWVLAAQVPGLPQAKAKRTIEPTPEALMAAIAGYRSRAASAGQTVERVITIYEAGWSGFWLARWLELVGSKFTSFNPRACRSTGERDAQSPTALMPSCCCARSSPGSEASRACARWCRFPTRTMRMFVAVFAREPNSCPNAPA